MNKRHQHLLDSYCSGSITDEEFIEFEDVLRVNKDFRKTFLEYRSIDASLRAKADVALTPLNHGMAVKEEVKVQAIWPKVLAFAAGFTILITGIILSVISKPPAVTQEGIEEQKPSIDTGKAILVRNLNTEWEGKTFQEGDSIPRTTLKLKSGWVELQFYSGVKVILEGPVEFEVQTENSGYLHLGRLSAKVPSHSHGFNITSADAKVIDLGTSFGMVVDSFEGTSVEVFEGEVAVIDLAVGSSLSDGVKLSEGEGLKVKKGKSSVSIPVEESSFLTTMQLTGKIQLQQEANFKRWRQKVSEDEADTRFLARYNFSEFVEQPDLLINNSYNKLEGLNGSIVGARWSEGLWLGKQALDFKRPGDCVHIDVPGKYESATLSAWIRLDGFDQNWSSLLLSDGWRRPGALHWQLNRTGFVELAVYVSKRINPNSRVPFKISPSDFGRWMHLAVVYNGKEKTVTHYRNGVASRPVQLKETVLLQIGKSQIGNWDSKEQREIRNFNGRMDDLAIYGEALSDKDIEELYNSSKP